jgi:hypothetical protein
VIEYNGWYTTTNYQASGYLTSSTTTLPVDLTLFTATKDNNNVLLKWSTASEQNNDHFTIERSADLKQWETIGKVKGAGNSSKKNNYLFQDQLSGLIYEPQVLYYRLRQTDFDGTFAYSKTAVVSFENLNTAAFSVSPNPFSDVLRISVQQPLEGDVTIRLKNLIDDTYVNKTVHFEHGNQQHIELSVLGNIPAGIYVLQLEYGKQTTHFKLIKQ